MNTKARVPDRGRVIAGFAILAAGVVLLIFQLTGRDLDFGRLWPLIVIGGAGNDCSVTSRSN